MASTLTDMDTPTGTGGLRLPSGQVRMSLLRAIARRMLPQKAFH
ncbi:hypothetical protein [Micromonospora sp. DT201]